MLTKAIIALGFLLILLGIVGIFGGNPISRNNAIERGLGPQRVEHQEMKNVPVTPLLSGIVLLGGIALVAVGARKT